MKLKFIAIASLITLTAGGALAQQTTPGSWANQHFSYNTADDKYRANELSLDLFGSYQHPEHKLSHLFQTDIRNHGVWGGGIGVNYFFTKQVGIGADMNIPNNDGAFVDQVQGSLIARVPIGNSGFAPYVFGGGGRGFDPVDEWLGHAGVGGEFRLNRMTGVFVDGRYVWADRSSNRALFRAGLRFAF